MREEGTYLYGIIEANDLRNYGAIGIGGAAVESITHRGLSAVISSTRMSGCAVSKENLMAHERVLEGVMSEHTVLPVKFGTVASNAEEIRGLLERRQTEIRQLLRELDGKVELGVKALWRDMEGIFREIVDGHEELKRLRAEIAGKPLHQSHAQRIAVGQMVEAALEVKKEAEREELLRDLRKLSVDCRLNRTIGDRMFLNAAFLVDRTREREFDHLMDRLDLRYRERVKFAYVGPVPPYNFVNITLHAAG